MPLQQTAVNVLAALKRELSATPGVASASGAGALQLRLLDSPGMRLDRGVIQSGEHRADFLKPMGRLGGRSTGGSYNLELTLGGAVDDLWEAIMRRLWSAPVAITTAGAFAAATLTVATQATTQTLTASAGDFIAAGLRVGDIISTTGFTTVANNSLRLRVVALSATVITVAGNLLVNGAQAAWTVTRAKKLTTTGVPTRFSYTIDQWDIDTDLTELFLGCRLTGVSLSMRPNANVTVAYTFMGLDRTLLTTVTSPWFTAPSVTAGLPLVSDDSVVRFNGADVTTFTGLDLTWAIAAAGQPVIGSQVSPDIFDNDLTLSGSLTGIRSDFVRAGMFDTETEFELAQTFIEPGVAPLGMFGIYIPRVKFSSLDAPFRGTDGPKIETLNLMIGPRVAASGFDASAMNLFSTAP